MNEFGVEPIIEYDTKTNEVVVSCDCPFCGERLNDIYRAKEHIDIDTLVPGVTRWVVRHVLDWNECERKHRTYIIWRGSTREDDYVLIYYPSIHGLPTCAITHHSGTVKLVDRKELDAIIAGLQDDMNTIRERIAVLKELEL